MLAIIDVIVCDIIGAIMYIASFAIATINHYYRQQKTCLADFTNIQT